MKGNLALAGAALLAGALVGVAWATQAPPPGPAPSEDRVGFPEGYQTDYTPFYVFDRPDNKQVRVIYGNAAAASARPSEPFPYGSVLVMETYRAIVDEQGAIVPSADGRYQRGELTGIFVMRKERDFGSAYDQNRTGEWEYVAYRPDKSFLTPPDRTAACAICHGDTKGERDWTFRTDLYFKNASGAVPRGLIQSYTFVPGAITVRAGEPVVWMNDDTAAHTVSATDGSWDSGRMLRGVTFTRVFEAPGSYEFQCNLHPAMKGRVVVE